MSPQLYLLDTSVLIALMNGKALGKYVDVTYGLSGSKPRPLACAVSHGELWALAAVNHFGQPKRQVISTMMAAVVTVGSTSSGPSPTLVEAARAASEVFVAHDAVKAAEKT